MQFKSIWLYTLLTVVSTVVSSAGFGQTTNGPTVTTADAERVCTTVTDPNKKIECIKGVLHGNGSGGSTNTCAPLVTQVSAARSKFNKSCSEISKTGITCQETYKNCVDGDTDDDDGDDGQEDESADPISGLLQPGQYSVKTQAPIPYARFKSCPAVALAQVKDKKDELERLRGEKEKLQDKVDDLRQKVADTAGLIAKAKAEFEATKSEANAAFRKAETELTKEQSEEVKQIGDQITQLSDELTTMVQLRPTAMALQYEEALIKIDESCQLEGERELANKRKDDIEKLKVSAKKQRNLKTLLELKVNGRIKTDELYRTNAIKRCRLNDARYKTPRDQAWKNYQLAVKNLAIETQKVRTKLGDLEQQLARKNPELAQKMGELKTQYNDAVTTAANKLSSEAGTCVGTQNQNGLLTTTSAANCTPPAGLYAEQLLQTKQLERNEAELRQTIADFNHVEKYFNAIVSATGGNSSGPSGEDLFASGADVVEALATLSNTQECASAFTSEMKQQLDRMDAGTSSDTRANGIDGNDSPAGASGAAGGAGAAGSGANGQSGTGTTRPIGPAAQ